MNKEKKIKKLKIGKCKYCGKKIDPSEIRCDICDFAWQSGYVAGEQNIKRALSDIQSEFINLLND